MKTHNYSTIQIVEAGLLSAISAVIYIILNLFASVPLSFAILKHSFKIGILSSIVSLIIIYLFRGYIDAFIFLSIFIPTGLSMAYLIKRKPVNSYTNIIFSSAVAFFIVILGIFFITYFLHIDIPKIVNNQFELAKNSSIKLMDKFNLNKNEINAKEILTVQWNYFKKILPAFLYIIIFINSFITYFILQYVCKSFKIPLPFFEKFLDFKIGDSFIWTVIICLAGILVFKKYNNVLFLFFLNISVILFIFYFIQGLAVIKFWFIKLRLHPFFQLLFFIIFFVMGLILFISIIGILDTWFEFRKPKEV